MAITGTGKRTRPLGMKNGRPATPTKATTVCTACDTPKAKRQFVTTSKGALVPPPICRQCRQAIEQEQAGAIDTRFPPRTCRLCGETKPASQLHIDKTGKPAPRCKACDRLHKRRAEKGIDGLYGHTQVDQAPDPFPAVHLREQLASARANGEPFASAWPDCVAYCLSCIDGEAGQWEWRRAFESTRSSWLAGWDRQSFTRVGEHLIEA